jgi:hypothetical protein
MALAGGRLQVLGGRHDQQPQRSLLAAAVDELMVHGVGVEVPWPPAPGRDAVRLYCPWSLECWRKPVERNWRGAKVLFLLTLLRGEGASKEFFVALAHRGRSFALNLAECPRDRLTR